MVGEINDIILLPVRLTRLFVQPHAFFYGLNLANPLATFAFPPLLCAARLFPLLLYHALSTRTLSFWTIFFGLLSPILRRKRHHSGAPTVKALL
jgi:hypothetical protein